MMQSVVSTKGQTVVPKEIRETLGLKPGTKLIWTVKNHSVVVTAVPSDPVRALRGLLKGSGYTFDDFLRERNEERERERKMEEEEEDAWRKSLSTRQR